VNLAAGGKEPLGLSSVDDTEDLQRRHTEYVESVLAALRAVRDPEERIKEVRKALDRCREHESCIAEITREAVREMLIAMPQLSKSALARRLGISPTRITRLSGTGDYPGRYKREGEQR
jgi:hypothetical protein